MVMRDKATCAMNVEELNDALNDALNGLAQREAVPLRPRAERGKVLVEYLLSILDAYEKATTRRLVSPPSNRRGSAT